jgi:hypothetical protein
VTKSWRFVYHLPVSPHNFFHSVKSIVVFSQEHPMKNQRTAIPKPSSFISFCVIFILVITNILFVQAAPGINQEGPIAGTVVLPPSAQQAPLLLSNETKTTRSGKMDSSLAELAETGTNSNEFGMLADSRNLRHIEDLIQVQVVTTPERFEGAKKAFENAGGQITGVSHDQTLLQGWLPFQALSIVSADSQVHYLKIPEQVSFIDEDNEANNPRSSAFIRVPEQDSISVPDAGSYTTEGLSVINGPAWHSAGLQGSGIKVAIIDAGFQGYNSLLGSDLPSSVTVKNFVDGESDAQVDGTTPHGAACAEIVYDIAPQATMYLAKTATNIDLQEAVDWAKSSGVRVISTSIGWYNISPGDGSGFFANLVNDARANGIFWTTSAGLDRESHWGGAYYDSDADNYHEFVTGQNVDYFGPGNGDAYNINPGFVFQVYLRWDDWSNVNQDYDLYLVRWNGQSWETVASSTNVQNGSSGQAPVEYAYYTTSGAAAPYGFMIARYSATRNVNLEAFSPHLARLDKIVTARSLINLADVADITTVAALDVNSPYPQEAYSPEGPTNGPGGTATGGFTKPDISAFANVSTASYGTTNKFSGTSAATPHVAGAAVLVKSANLSYTPAQVESFLTGRAVDMGASGMDNIYGYGRLNLGAPPSTNTAPSLSGLPDQFLSINSSKNNAIDLWSYASDNESPDSALTFTINNTPNPSAGVSLDSNRYIDINPASGWSGSTDVIIKVSDPGSLTGTDTFKVTVAQAQYLYMPLTQQRWSPPLSPGFWSGQGVEFYVSPDSKNVRNFTVKFSLQNCPGTHVVTQSGDTTIIDNKFSFGGSYYASGTFTSITAANGTVGFDNYYLSECGFDITTSIPWNAAWQNNSQPTSAP